jgi:hypothetical protein
VVDEFPSDAPTAIGAPDDEAQQPDVGRPAGTGSQAGETGDALAVDGDDTERPVVLDPRAHVGRVEQRGIEEGPIGVADADDEARQCVAVGGVRRPDDQRFGGHGGGAVLEGSVTNRTRPSRGGRRRRTPRVVDVWQSCH